MRGLARCPLTAAYLACTPPDRPCPRVPVLHVRRLINSLLSRHHGADPLYDVTPDLRGEEESTDALAMSNAAMLDPARFVRVHERTGLTLEGAQDALRILSSGASASVAPANEAALAAAFAEEDFDLHVFSEESEEYSRVVFSPRSREGHDWSHAPCSPEYARTRCREVARWLHAAATCGVHVGEWVVLDDDDLQQTGTPPVRPMRRPPSCSPEWRPAPTGVRGTPQNNPLRTRQDGEGGAVADGDAHPGETPPAMNAEEMGWEAFAF